MDMEQEQEHQDAISYILNSFIESVTNQVENYYEEGDEIVCFDPTSLAIRFKFGRGRFSEGAFGMAVAGDELFVGDGGAHRNGRHGKDWRDQAHHERLRPPRKRLAARQAETSPKQRITTQSQRGRPRPGQNNV